jgi:ADP-ribosyltransferase exoenzyme
VSWQKLNQWALKKDVGDWDEALHPRDYHGRFTHKMGAGAGDLSDFGSGYTGDSSSSAVWNAMKIVSDPKWASHVVHTANGVSKYQLGLTTPGAPRVLSVKKQLNGKLKVWINSGHLKSSGGISKTPVTTKELTGKATSVSGYSEPKTFYNHKSHTHVVIQPDGSGKWYDTPTGEELAGSGSWAQPGHYKASVIQQWLQEGKWSENPESPKPLGLGTWQADPEKAYQMWTKGILTFQELQQHYNNDALNAMGIDVAAIEAMGSSKYKPGKHYLDSNGHEWVLQQNGKAKLVGGVGGAAMSLDGSPSALSAEAIKDKINSGEWKLQPDSPFDNGLTEPTTFNSVTTPGLSTTINPDGSATTKYTDGSVEQHPVGSHTAKDVQEFKDEWAIATPAPEAQLGITPPGDVGIAIDMDTTMKAAHDIVPGDVINIAGYNAHVTNVTKSGAYYGLDITWLGGPMKGENGEVTYSHDMMLDYTGKAVPDNTPSGSPQVGYSGYSHDIVFKNAADETFTIHPDGSGEITYGSGDPWMQGQTKMSFPPNSYGPTAISEINPDVWHEQLGAVAAPAFTPHYEHISDVQPGDIIEMPGSGGLQALVHSVTDSGVDYEVKWSPPHSPADVGTSYLGNGAPGGLSANVHVVGHQEISPSLTAALQQAATEAGHEGAVVNPQTLLASPKKWDYAGGGSYLVNPDGSGHEITPSGDHHDYLPGYFDAGDVANLDESYPEAEEETPSVEPPADVEAIGAFSEDEQLHLDVTEVPGQWKSDNGGPMTGQPGFEKLPNELGVGSLPTEAALIETPDLDTAYAVKAMYDGVPVSDVYNTPTQTVYRLVDGNNLVFTKTGAVGAHGEDAISAKLVSDAELPNRNIGSGALPKLLSQVRCNSVPTRELKNAIYKGTVQVTQSVPASDRITVCKTSDGQFIQFERRDMGMYAKIVSESQVADYFGEAAVGGEEVATNVEAAKNVAAIQYLLHDSASEGVKWANAAFAHVTLPAAGKAALKSYTNGTYSAINHALGHGHGLLTHHTAAVNNIDAAMKVSATPVAVRLVRGAGFELFNDAQGHPFPIEQAIGKTIKNKAYSSTSVGKIPAFSGKAVHLNIHCPAGTHMCWVKNFSNYGSENEMVLDRNLNFYFQDVKKIGNKYYCEVYVIPDADVTDVIVPAGTTQGPAPSTLTNEAELLGKATKFANTVNAYTIFPDGSAIDAKGKYFASGSAKKGKSAEYIVLPDGTQQLKSNGTNSPMAGTTAPKPGKYTHSNGATLQVYPDGHAEYDGTVANKGNANYSVGMFKQEQISNSGSWTYQGGATLGQAVTPSQPVGASSSAYASPTPATPVTPVTPTGFDVKKLKPNPLKPGYSVQTLSSSNTYIGNDKSNHSVQIDPGADHVYQNGAAGAWMVVHPDGTALLFKADGTPAGVAYGASKQTKLANWNHIYAPQKGEEIAAQLHASEQPGAKAFSNAYGTAEYVVNPDGSGYYLYKNDGTWNSKPKGSWMAEHFAANSLYKPLEHSTLSELYAPKPTFEKPKVPNTHHVWTYDEKTGAAHIKNYKSWGGVQIMPGDKLYQNGQAGKWLVLHPNGQGDVYAWDGGQKTKATFTQIKNAKQKWNLITDHAVAVQAAKDTLQASTETSDMQSHYDTLISNWTKSLEPGSTLWENHLIPLKSHATSLKAFIEHPDGSIDYVSNDGKKTGHYHSMTNGFLKNVKSGVLSGWQITHKAPEHVAVNPTTGLSEPQKWVKPSGATLTINPDGSGAATYGGGDAATTTMPAGSYDASDVAFMNSSTEWKKAQ